MDYGRPAFTDYPLTFSSAVGRPSIWHLVSEYEFMKKISDEMHSKGKLATGNGHGWNPFAASNLELFGAKLSWYSSGDHNVIALRVSESNGLETRINSTSQ